MKFKNCKKIVLPAVMTALLASVPVTSNAYTVSTNNYNGQKVIYTNTIVQKSNSYYITVSPSPSKQTGTTSGSKNYYVVSRGGYTRPGTIINQTPVVKPNVTPIPNDKPSNNVDTPTEQPTTQPKPVEKPVEKPVVETAPKPTTEVNTGSTSNAKHSLSASEIKLVEYVNKARQDAGLQPLQIDVDLAYVARVKSQDMHDNNYFSHDSAKYGSPFEMMTKFGIKYRGAAENIAKTQSVEAAHNGFMRSQGHKDNILNPIYTHIGIGIHNGYYTQMFIRK